jgi:hypothetical protein
MSKRTKPEPPRDKKERVIHTRVPEALDDEVRKRAGHLGLSVSNLVRNILENTFGLVEDIVADSANIARTARGKITEPAGAADDHVLGWTIAVLNLNAICGLCNAILSKGSRAGIGVRRRGPAAEFRCLNCLKENEHDESPHLGQRRTKRHAKAG